VPYLVFSLAIEPTKTIIEDDNVLLGIYGSCERLHNGVSAKRGTRWGERDASLCVDFARRSMQYPCFQSGFGLLAVIGVDLHLMRNYGQLMNTIADRTHWTR
jgi:hypothetical protein